MTNKGVMAVCTCRRPMIVTGYERNAHVFGIEPWPEAWLHCYPGWVYPPFRDTYPEGVENRLRAIGSPEPKTELSSKSVPLWPAEAVEWWDKEGYLWSRSGADWRAVVVAAAEAAMAIDRERMAAEGAGIELGWEAYWPAVAAK